MRVRIVTIAIAISILCFSAQGYVKANERAERYIAAIKKIKSYDVVLRLDILDASTVGLAQKDEDKIISTSNWHDVFAVGLGRRIEDNWDDPANQKISVKSWGTIRSSKESLASALVRLGPADYFIYYNPIFPIASGKLPITYMFLDELLTDKSVTVEDIEASKSLTIATMPLPQDARGIRIVTNKLIGPVHVWLDPKSGFMPCRIEEYARSGPNTVHLSHISVMQIDRYKKVGPDVWVPVAARSAELKIDRADGIESAAVGPTDKAELAWPIDTVTVNESISSWNSVHDRTKFEVSSLPRLNHEQSGWKEYCGTERLGVVEAGDKVRQAAREAAAGAERDRP